MNIFVSSQRIDEPHTAALISKLSGAGFQVVNSPRNPVDGDDERWGQDWYHDGLIKALDAAKVFIASIDQGWDSATWMAIESEEALKRHSKSQILYMYYYNPCNVVVNAGWMLRYLQEQLPNDLGAVIEVLNKLTL